MGAFATAHDRAECPLPVEANPPNKDSHGSKSVIRRSSTNVVGATQPRGAWPTSASAPLDGSNIHHLLVSGDDRNAGSTARSRRRLRLLTGDKASKVKELQPQRKRIQHRRPASSTICTETGRRNVLWWRWLKGAELGDLGLA